MQAYLSLVLASALTDLALLAPFFILAYIRTQPRPGPKPLLLFAAFLTLDIALVMSFKLDLLVPAWGGWNWQGKILETVWPVLLGLAVPAFAARRIGLALPSEPGAWRALGIAAGIYVVLGVPLMLIMGARFGVDGDAATFAYQATLPGLGEEIVYRGLLLALLDGAFGRPWQRAGARFGWGAVIVTAMFGFVHGVDAKSLGDIHLHWGNMLFPAATGVLLVWLKERTGSVWPCVLLHNFINVLNHLMV
jgi:membrane protease YdiL (CAAX protease family)